MAKRRGRLPVARGRATFFSICENDIAEKKSEIAREIFKSPIKAIVGAFSNAKRIKVNEAANLARYLLRLFDLDVETSIEVEGTGYDYTVFVRIGDVTVELIQNKNEEALAA